MKDDEIELLMDELERHGVRPTKKRKSNEKTFDLELTLHAKERMEERKVTLAQVKTCVLKGVRRLRSSGSGFCYKLKNLFVIVDNLCVITVYRRGYGFDDFEIDDYDDAA